MLVGLKKIIIQTHSTRYRLKAESELLAVAWWVMLAVEIVVFQNPTVAGLESGRAWFAVL